MNKSEKLIAVLLGLVLLGYLYFDFSGRKTAENAAPQPVQTVEQAAVRPQAPASVEPVVDTVKAAEWTVPEQLVELENGEAKLVLTSRGGAVKRAVMKLYAQNRGSVGEDNPPYEFDFGESPLGSLGEEFAFAQVEGDTAIFATGAGRVRRVTLKPGYLVEFADEGLEGRREISLGAVSMGSGKNDLLSVDAWDLGGKKPHVVHYSETEPLKGLLAGATGGCSSSANASGMPRVSPRIPVQGDFTWVALKNRFFVAALSGTTGRISEFSAQVERDAASDAYRPKTVQAGALLEADGQATSVFYIGPKKQALLSELGMRDVMEFGMWRWICYPLVWTLNLFHGWIPSYGVAIILLTVLVRLLFWPLTHKSTVGMKKMQEIQPLMKEIQAKYKDNPQRLQQETMKLYREHKVNPLSSCLPMLIQIPVFIALFNVLRSAVELRYAGFLWIPDLSEPEGLFSAYLPFGGLNILPILMAVTMALQSALTPQAGDKSQQRMMMVMMPVMMLVMFYNFPSALSLYWTLSQVLSIVQMWLIRRRTNAAGLRK
jgi:YidC/Oxa1 family membrane protein insertase